MTGHIRRVLITGSRSPKPRSPQQTDKLCWGARHTDPRSLCPDTGCTRQDYNHTRILLAKLRTHKNVPGSCPNSAPGRTPPLRKTQRAYMTLFDHANVWADTLCGKSVRGAGQAAVTSATGDEHACATGGLDAKGGFASATATPRTTALTTGSPSHTTS
jgi:hypothetical protein